MPIPQNISFVKAGIQQKKTNETIQIRVHSLGHIELTEESLRAENGSKTVKQCIIRLSSSSSNLGLQEEEEKDLLLELSDGFLKIFDKSSGLILQDQPIHTIRFWGIGQEDSHNFGYVAWDRQTRRYLCHVFRCDIQARFISNALRGVCEKILRRRRDKSFSANKTSRSLDCPAPDSTNKKSSPSNLGPDFNEPLFKNKTDISPESTLRVKKACPRSFITARMLGTAIVRKPCGMDVINDSIESLVKNVPKNDWEVVKVHVDPSKLTISFMDIRKSNLEFSLRLVSFLGISELSIHFCAFVVQTEKGQFVSHVFYCEPNAGKMCKTIQGACITKYQNVISNKTNI